MEKFDWRTKFNLAHIRVLIMPRTITRHESSLFLDEGGVEFADVRASKPRSTVVFRVGTTASTGLHWHQDKTGRIDRVHQWTLDTISDIC
jgi:hypothetical protein